MRVVQGSCCYSKYDFRQGSPRNAVIHMHVFKLNFAQPAVRWIGLLASLAMWSATPVHAEVPGPEPSALGSARPLTLHEAGRLALLHNPSQRAQRATLEGDALQVQQAEDAYWPSVGFSAGYNHSLTTGATLKYDASGNGQFVSVTEGLTMASSAATLQGSYVAWDFGVRSANLERAKLQEHAARQSLAAGQQQLLQQVANAYVSVLTAPADDSAAARSARFLASAQLSSLLGLPLDRALAVVAPEELSFEAPGEWQDWWRLAEHRPDLQALRLRVRAEESSLAATKAARYGTVSLNVSRSWGYSDVSKRNTANMVSLTYSLPLFNGYPSGVATQTAQAQLAARRAEEDGARAQAQLDVMRAWDAYRVAYEAARPGQGPAETSHEATPGATDSMLYALLLARIGLLQAVGQLDLSTLTTRR